MANPKPLHALIGGASAGLWKPLTERTYSEGDQKRIDAQKMLMDLAKHGFGLAEKRQRQSQFEGQLGRSLGSQTAVQQGLARQRIAASGLPIGSGIVEDIQGNINVGQLRAIQEALSGFKMNELDREQQARLQALMQVFGTAAPQKQPSTLDRMMQIGGKVAGDVLTSKFS